MVLSYEGGGFHGWQKQTNAGVQLRTVEKVLEDELRPNPNPNPDPNPHR